MSPARLKTSRNALSDLRRGLHQYPPKRCTPQHAPREGAVVLVKDPVDFVLASVFLEDNPAGCLAFRSLPERCPTPLEELDQFIVREMTLLPHSSADAFRGAGKDRRSRLTDAPLDHDEVVTVLLYPQFSRFCVLGGP